MVGAAGVADRTRMAPDNRPARDFFNIETTAARAGGQAATIAAAVAIASTATTGMTKAAAGIATGVVRAVKELDRRRMEQTAAMCVISPSWGKRHQWEV
mmetsp:Transcript_44668/g.87859  ORF Transcript_44668/g.87859 Transcript_44668/m.87859 type:complete len:99 (+) Transcript_44668:83-379(+)